LVLLMSCAWKPSSAPEKTPTIVPTMGFFLKHDSSLSQTCMEFGSSPFLSARQGARLIGLLGGLQRVPCQCNVYRSDIKDALAHRADILIDQSILFVCPCFRQCPCGYWPFFRTINLFSGVYHDKKNTRVIPYVAKTIALV
jgi:hypothetical protein